MKAHPLHVASVATVSALILATCVPAASAKDITLTVWHLTADPPALMNLYKAYEQASGNHIEFVDMPADGFEGATLTKWATGDRPDIIEWHSMRGFLDQLNPQQNLYDLTDEPFVAKSRVYDVGGRSGDGKVYIAITTFPENWGLFYNKKVLADHGLRPATTFAEIQAQCATLSAAGIVTLNQSGASAWPVQVMPNLYVSTEAPTGWAEKLLTREVSINDTGGVYTEGFNAWSALRKAGCFNADMLTATFEDSAAAVFSGKAAYDMIHSNMVSVYMDKAGGDAALLDSKVGFTHLGGKAKKAVVSTGPIGSFAVPKTGNSQKEAAALDFVRFATGEGYGKYIEESGTFPIIAGTADPSDTSELLKQIKAGYDAGPLVPLAGSTLPGGLGNANQVMSEYIAGQIDVQQAVDQIQKGLEASAQAQGLPGF